jgi:hypothetical protein
VSDDRKHPEATGGGGLKADDESTRPQRGGEAATTRFGMEEGDNTDIPATGSAADDDEASAHPS